MQAFDSTTNSGRTSIIEAYRVAVTESADHISFKTFCDDNGISDYRKILWWCRDRKISVKRIQAQCVRHNETDSPSIVQIRPATIPISSSSLSNISITFPDGVNLALQECSIENVARLLAIYSSRSRTAGGQ